MLKRIGKITAITLAIYLSFRYLLGLVFPFVIAGMVAVIYYPLLRHLHGGSKVWNGKGRKPFLAFSLIVFYGIVILLFGLILGGVLGQGQSIILNIPFYQTKLICLMKNCCGRVDGWFKFSDGESYAYLTRMAELFWGKSLSAMVPKMTGISVRMAGKLFNLIFEILITVIATFFLIQDYEEIRGKLLGSEPGIAFCKVVTKCRATLGTYLRTQGIIMLLDGVLCAIAFYFAGQPYYLTLGPLVALVDALPVFGSGIFLIPYGAVLLIYGEVKKSLIIFAAYGGCILVRQIMEPKMMGNKIGVRPLYMIMAMYIGFRLFGPVGFFMGPIGVLVGKEVYKLDST